MNYYNQQQQHLTLKGLYNNFTRKKGQSFLTIEEMQHLNNDAYKMEQYQRFLNAMTNKRPPKNSYQNHLKRKKIEEEVKRMDIITSLHIEKDKDKNLLNKVIIPRPWTVGLIVNLAVKYDRNGNKFKEKEKVKCLTTLYLAGNLTLSQTREYFNDVKKVPCSTLKQYCGLLAILFAISGFESLEIAKQALFCWKNKTRGRYSRFECGKVIYNLFKGKANPNLKFYSPSLNPRETIKILQQYNKK